jgi:hypothetical protein
MRASRRRGREGAPPLRLGRRLHRVDYALRRAPRALRGRGQQDAGGRRGGHEAGRGGAA